MIYALDILLLVAAYTLNSLIVIMDGTIQPYFQKYGVQKVVVARVLATIALNVPVIIYFPVVFAVIAVIQVGAQVWYYRDLKKAFDQWSRV